MYHIDRLFCEVAAKARFEVITGGVDGGLFVWILFGFCITKLLNTLSRRIVLKLRGKKAVLNLTLI